MNTRYLHSTLILRVKDRRSALTLRTPNDNFWPNSTICTISRNQFPSKYKNKLSDRLHHHLKVSIPFWKMLKKWLLMEVCALLLQLALVCVMGFSPKWNVWKSFKNFILKISTVRKKNKSFERRTKKYRPWHRVEKSKMSSSIYNEAIILRTESIWRQDNEACMESIDKRFLL